MYTRQSCYIRNGAPETKGLAQLNEEAVNSSKNGKILEEFVEFVSDFTRGILIGNYEQRFNIHVHTLVHNLVT